ncbi:MAG: YqaJ viral recombinase family protein [Methylophilales bacterium]|nr:YqaJ viral recombinase family protein [Methylophilales bacterium]
MQQHNLVQGTPEWHAYRSDHFNASDAPAMMGLSKYKTRSQLMHEMKTGIVPDVSNFTQKMFDAGHHFEDLARPIAEKIIEQDLSPVTGSLGPYSASFDGLTFMGDIAFEHKTLNDAIRNCRVASDLDEMYLIQMEQQLLVSGAEKCLFMATKWSDSDELIEAYDFMYLPNLDRRQRILDGWDQFADDMDAYVPAIEVPEVVAENIIELPALFVHAKGEIINSNLDLYDVAVKSYLVSVKTTLVDDQDFANAEADAKRCREACDRLKLSKDAMLAQTMSIGDAARLMDKWYEDFRLMAVKLEKAVTLEKDNRKAAMITKAMLDLSNHIQQYDANQPWPTVNFASAIKGKSKLSAMQDAIDDMLAKAKIEATATARDAEILKLSGEVVSIDVTPEKLREVVVENQDVIASFFKSHKINPDKYNEYRAVIVEFIKHQASFNLKQAA